MIGHSIRFLHIIIIFITVAIPFIPNINSTILETNTILLIIILFMFIKFDGCIVSRFERKYLKDKWTPIDTLCYLISIEPTSKSRKRVTFYFLILLILFSLLRVYTD
jgi:hypothetical protein